MPDLVLKSFPTDLHARLTRTAAAHRRSLTQETIHLLEKALGVEPAGLSKTKADGLSYWARPRLLPEYEALLQSGGLSGGADSSLLISEERDAR